MDQRLFRDQLRRNRWNFVWLTALVMLLWTSGAVIGGFSPHFIVAASMSLTVVAGPLLASQANPREVLLLPVSRTELWRTRWWMSLVVPVGFIATGKFAGWLLAGAPGGQPVGLELVGLSSLMDLAYAGSLMSVLPWIHLSGMARRKRPGRRAGFLSVVLVLLSIAPVAGMVIPFALQKRLPTAWTELSAVGAILIVLGLGLAGLAYAVTPRTVAQVTPAAVRTTRGAGWSPRLPAFAGLTGLRLLIARTWTIAALMQLGITLTALVGVYVYNVWMGTPEGSRWADTAREIGLLPFEMITSGPIWAMLFMVGRAGNDGTTRSLRHLRALPLGTRQLGVLLLTLPLIVWPTAWLLLAGVHVMVSDQPISSLQLPLFLGLIGIDSLLRAFELRWQKPWLLFLVFVFAGMIAYAAQTHRPAVDAGLVLTGLIGLGVAAAMNLKTISHSRLVYLPGPRRTMFGQELPD
jgi:hypothetical protein